MVRQTPNPIDIHVGRRLRQKRKECGISQSTLAEIVGVSSQQIQKYEKAKDRISASRLYRIARFLNTDTNYFFNNFP